MNNSKRNRFIQIGILIAIIIAILLFLVKCTGGEEEYPVAPPLTYEQDILRIMKQDEAVLVSLYQMSDIGLRRENVTTYDRLNLSIRGGK